MPNPSRQQANLRPSSPPAAPAPFSATSFLGSEVLEHPLPTGMRDLLPEEAEIQATIGTKVIESFELYGYRRVGVPAFEYACVIEKGIGTLDPGAVLRFVEPESGEVVVLRPDMTPQIARLVATRLREVSGPARLCYKGSVLRRRQERARRRRQIQQVGFELVGAAAEIGDLEVLEAATAAVKAAGLLDFTLDIAHAEIAGALVGDVGGSERAELFEALSVKDSSVLLRRGERLGLGGRVLEALVQLPELHGGDEIWPRALKLLRATPAEGPVLALQRLWHWANERQIAPKLVVDLGEVRRFDYYTGFTFNILAHGPGEPVGSGGRYDRLYEQFGIPRPAAGFAVELSNLCWALEASGQRPQARRRLAIVGDVPERAALLAALRGQGVAAAVAPVNAASDTDELDRYARAWGYDATLVLSAAGSAHELNAVLRGLAPGAVAQGTPARDTPGTVAAAKKLRSRGVSEMALEIVNELAQGAASRGSKRSGSER